MALDLYGRANRLSRKNFIEAGQRIGVPRRATARMLDQVCSGVERGAGGVEEIGFAEWRTEILHKLLICRIAELR